MQSTNTLMMCVWRRNDASCSKSVGLTAHDSAWLHEWLPFLLCGSSNIRHFDLFENQPRHQFFVQLGHAVWMLHLVAVRAGDITLEESTIMRTVLEDYLFRTQDVTEQQSTAIH